MQIMGWNKAQLVITVSSEERRDGLKFVSKQTALPYRDRNEAGAVVIAVTWDVWGSGGKIYHNFILDAR
jgi:hypothetical protein